MTTSKTKAVQYFLARYLLRRRYLTASADPPGVRLRFKIEDAVGRHIYKRGGYEPAITRYLMEQLHCREGDVLLDVGANLGWYSLLFDRIAPAGVAIYAFEADPFNFGLLRHNLQLNGATRVTAINKAIAETESMLTLHRYPNKNLGRHSLLPLPKATQTVEVPSISLDGFWEQAALEGRRPRFMKIDIEGYELFALRGAEELLTRCPEILLEHAPGYMKSGGVSARDLVDFLAGLHFKPYRLDERGLTPLDPQQVVDLEKGTDVLWSKETKRWALT